MNFEERRYESYQTIPRDTPRAVFRVGLVGAGKEGSKYGRGATECPRLRSSGNPARKDQRTAKTGDHYSARLRSFGRAEFLDRPGIIDWLSRVALLRSVRFV